MAGTSSFSKLPGGNVRPCRIVTLQTDNTVIECDGSADPWGISQPSTRNLPLSGYGTIDDGFAGIAGDPGINIFGPGADACKLELGGTVTIGSRIKATTGGAGVAATTDHDKAIAIAQEAGVSGDLIWVKPMRFDLSV